MIVARRWRGSIIDNNSNNDSDNANDEQAQLQNEVFARKERDNDKNARQKDKSKRMERRKENMTKKVSYHLAYAEAGWQVQSHVSSCANKSHAAGATLSGACPMEWPITTTSCHSSQRRPQPLHPIHKEIKISLELSFKPSFSCIHTLHDAMLSVRRSDGS